MNRKKKYFNQQTTAEFLGLTTRQVSNLAEAGMPTRVRAGRREYIWPDAFQWFIAHKVNTAVAKKAPADFTKARARKTEAEANLAEIELARAQGELITLDEAEKRLDDICARIEAVLNVIPSKFLGRIQAARTELEAHDVGEKIKEETKAALCGIADELDDALTAKPIDSLVTASAMTEPVSLTAAAAKPATFA